MKSWFWLVGICLAVLNVKAQTYTRNNDSIHIASPVSRIVYQRDGNNKATVHIRGNYTGAIKTSRARLVVRKEQRGSSTGWQTLEVDRGGNFSGNVVSVAGWYDLELELTPTKGKIRRTKVERIGIGEVFVTAGHSVAQGGDINGGGAGDDRVSTIALDEKSPTFQKYLETGNPQYLPPLQFVNAGPGIAHAPFGHGTYFWSEFAGCVAKKWDVPVLIFNAAFGGTNLEHWAKATRGENFEHGFVKSRIRMPYINLFNAMRRYISVTGLRAILADHGQNDNGERDAQVIFNNYKVFMEAARRDLAWDQLALVVNRQTTPTSTAIRQAQEMMIKEPNSFPGPDYDSAMLPEDRYDGIHLSLPGIKKAANLWCEALDRKFFDESKPFIPGKLLNSFPLYSDTIPYSMHSADNEYMENGVAVLKVSRPTLTAYLPAARSKPTAAIIICPGGGYGSLMMTYEGHDVARELSKKGIAAFVLKYRLPDSEIMQHRSTGPLQDLFQAIKIVRSRHVEYNIDSAKIGVMGFSAGGHLAASAGILDNLTTIPDSIQTKPDFMLLIYPVVTMDTTSGHKGSTFNLLGKNPSAEEIKKFSLEQQVNKNTPPAFIAVAADDDLLSNSMMLFSAMKKNKISCELHVYSDGGHGFLKYPAYAQWSQLFIDWMKHHGITR